jgi:hydroxypyruvate isomerase
MTIDCTTRQTITRRCYLRGSAAVCAAALLPGGRADAGQPPPRPEAPPEDYRIKNGRIKQSVMTWMFKIPPEAMIEVCHRMGMHAIDGIGNGKDVVEKARKRGLAVNSGSAGFKNAPLNREQHEGYLAAVRQAIDANAAVGISRMIVFTGYREKGITDQQAKRNCIEAWKKLAPYAEEKKVTMCLEILNSRDNSGWMTGHPGYFGDDVDLCADLIREVGSPRLKLLFDIYHVQIMNGDLIHRIRQYRDIIGHVHTAGVPGRHELDESQEINYPAVMRALIEVGYQGYVAHEFIPTWPDKLAALRHAVKLCDV